MERKKVIYGAVIVLALVVSGFFAWNSYQISKDSDKAIKLPSQISEKCGIETCHGLDITCGPNVPDNCPMMYAGGDNCRQFVNCQIIDGQCTLEKSSQFDACKACVEKCERDFPDDLPKFFGCENKCADSPKN